MIAHKPDVPSPKCPQCGGAVIAAPHEAMPFCSVRCQQIDLGRWLGEEHSVPHERNLDELDEEDLDASANDDMDTSYGAH